MDLRYRDVAREAISARELEKEIPVAEEEILAALAI
jgi:hypothetical protein